MKSYPIAVMPLLPSHPFAMPSIPSPPNTFEMSEKSAAYVSSPTPPCATSPPAAGARANAKREHQNPVGEAREIGSGVTAMQHPVSELRALFADAPYNTPPPPKAGRKAST